MATPDGSQTTQTGTLTGTLTGTWDEIINVLQQRELLAPCLLLSAGYVEAPFFLRQLFLLLLPLLAILGFSPHRQEEHHVASE